jgi:hypothetical protein
LLQQENETKRLRAQKKAEEEAKARRDKELQIDAERKALQAAKLQKAQIEDRLAKSMITLWSFFLPPSDNHSTSIMSVLFLR